MDSCGNSHLPPAYHRYGVKKNDQLTNQAESDIVRLCFFIIILKCHDHSLMQIVLIISHPLNNVYDFFLVWKKLNPFIVYFVFVDLLCVDFLVRMHPCAD
jgi:hypothetical protein